MTLFKENNDGKIPANAKIITKQEILSVYQKIFQTWNPKSEIRAITNGPVALGVSSALTGMYINNYFRRKLRLGLFGQFSSYLPIVIIPTIVTSMFHQMYVQTDMIINPGGCTMCYHSNSILIQLAFGIVQPGILAPLSSLMFATRHFTYRIPSPITQRASFLKFLRKISTPLQMPMLIAFGLQSVLSIIVTEWELKTLNRVNEKISPETFSEELRRLAK